MLHRPIESTDFHLLAAPLDFRDIGAFVPAFAVPGSLRFEAWFTGSSALVEFRAEGGSFDGATFQATGAFTPATRDSVRYVVDATLRGLRPDQWVANAPTMQPLDLDARLALAGPMLDSMSGTVHLAAGAVEVADTEFLPTTLDATLTRGAARYTLTGGVARLIRVDATGSARPFDSAAVVTMDANLRQVSDTTFGPVRLANAHATAHVAWARATGVVTIGARATADPGSATLRARLRPLDTDPTWTIDRLAVAEIDLARLNDEWPVSSLNAALSGSGRGFAPASLAGTSLLRVAPSPIGAERIDTATFVLALDAGVVDIRGDARAPRGSATLAAAVMPLGDTLTFRVDSLRFRDLVLDTTSTDPRYPRLAGMLTASGALPRDTFPQVTGVLALDPVTWNAARLMGGQVTFAIVGAEATVDATLRTGEGEVTFTGTARLARSDSGGIRLASGHGSGRARLPDLGPLLGRDSAAALDARFTVAADGVDPRAAHWSAQVTATGAYATIVVDTLRLDGRLARGVLHLDTLLLRSNVATGEGAGVLAITDWATPPDSGGLHVRLVADSGIAITEALALDQFSLRGGLLTLDATNSDGGIDARARLLVRGLISEGPWTDSLQVDGTARVDGRTLGAMHARWVSTDIGYGTFHLEAIRGTVDYDSTRARFDVTITGDDRHTMRVTGTALPRERAMTFTDMAVALEDRRWALAAPATLVLGPRMTIDNFTLRDGERRIVIGGVLDRAGTQDLSLAFHDVPLRGFAEFAGFDGLDGTLDGTVRVSGPARRVVLESDLNVQLLGTTGTIALTPADDGRLGVEARFVDQGDRTLRVEGTVPFALSLAAEDPTGVPARGALELAVAADSFSLGWLTPLIRPRGVERLEGLLRADVRVTGTYDDPVMAGTAALMRGRIDYPRQGVAYRDVGGEFTFDGPRIRVISLRATSEGTAVVEGEIVMADAASPRLDLRARFDRFRAARNEWIRLGLSGAVTITGDVDAPVLAGQVQLVDTDIYADPVGRSGAGQAVELTRDDYQMLASYFGYRPERAPRPDPLEAMALELDVTLGADTWLRRRTQPEMRIQLDGSLDVRKQANDSLQVFGTIAVLPERSSFEQFGRRFQVASGTVTFNGPMMGWIATFQTRYIVPSTQDVNTPEVVITLAVRGGLDDLDLTLGAEPSMEMSDVLSYLATGRPAASAAAFGGAGGGGVGDLGASFAAGQLAGVLERSAAEHVGLDVIEIRHDGIKGATIIAGRYVSPRLFVGFEQPLTLRRENEATGRAAQQSAEVQLEYAAYRWLMLHLQRGSSSFEVFLRVRRSF